MHTLTDNRLYAIIAFWLLVGMGIGFVIGYTIH